MQLKEYHKQGLYAGLLLFSGTWLTAYYNSWLLSLVTMLAFGIGLYIAGISSQRGTDQENLVQGAITGLVAGIVARALGMVSVIWAFGSTTMYHANSYGVIGGFFAHILNGSVVGTLIALAMCAVFGACMAYFEPQQKPAKMGAKK